ncbi:autotransporter beta-domain protein, partial [Chlamydia psittaci 84-8471/1]
TGEILSRGYCFL